MLKSLFVRLSRQASRWFNIDAETRVSIYISTIVGTKLSNIPYWFELLLACGIATLGLALNSAAVVIGAMLISPLMTPIMGIGLALATGDIFLGVRAIVNLLLSVAAALAAAVFFTSVLPFKEVTSEILARTQPTILDLVVALLSGLAGSVATLKSSKGLTAALPGTAIAVALMPPLCVVGFGVGIRHYDPQWISVAKGSGLLFAANLVAIVLTSMLVFLVVGMGGRRVKAQVDEWQSRPGNLSRLETWLSRRRFGMIWSKIGTLQARLAVILVFFLLVYFPLQEALNRVVAQVQKRGREQTQVKVIHEIGQGLFRVKNRSDIEKISIENAPDGLRAVVRVSTNWIFGSEEKGRFERLASERLKVPVRLILIQSPGFFGEEKETDWAGFFGVGREERSVPPEESYQRLFGRIQSVVQGLWPLPLAQLLGLKFFIEEAEDGEITPRLKLAYLAAEALSQDAKHVFSNGVRQSLGFEPSIEWQWVPSRYGPFPLSFGRVLLSPEAKEEVVRVGKAIKEFPELEIELLLLATRQSGREGRRHSSALASRLSEEMEAQGIPPVSLEISELPEGSPRLLVSLRRRAEGHTPTFDPSPFPELSESVPAAEP